MAQTGTWDENNLPQLPGFYNRFKTVALKTIGPGIHGTLAIPIKANWGPAKTVVKVANERVLKETFGSDMNYSAYKLGRLALLGKPKELLLYRLVDDAEKVATIILKNSESTPTDFITLSTKYPTTRPFNVTIRTNLTDSTQKDLILFEGTKKVIELKGLSGTVDEIVSAINDNLLNTYIVASKVTGATGALANIVNIPLIGGNDGCANITNEYYLDAMAAFEKYKIDGFTLDGVTDESLQNSVKSWVTSLKENGTDVIAFVGGDGTGADSVLRANARSLTFNNENIINVGSDGLYESITYTPAEVAIYVAGLAMGQNIKQCLCNQTTIFEDTNIRLSKEEMQDCIDAGTLIFSVDDGEVVIVDDKNTYTKYTDEKNETMGYLRAVRFTNIVNQDTALKRKEYIGKALNGANGQTTVICALKQYFEAIANEGIIENFTVQVDYELQAKAKNDEFFWRWDAKYINVMKKIYGTGYIR